MVDAGCKFVNLFTLSTVLIISTQDIIAKDLNTHGAMIVPIMLGSDKTMVLVATGNNEYWPVYLSIGNIYNNICQAHHNGLLLLGFLPIPKSMWLVIRLLS